MSENSKDDIIADAYNQFYGSMKNTLAQARKVDKSIKYEDVKRWFEKSFVRKDNLKGYNSFVAQEPYQEYQIDLFFINDLQGQE